MCLDSLFVMLIEDASLIHFGALFHSLVASSIEMFSALLSAYAGNFGSAKARQSQAHFILLAPFNLQVLLIIFNCKPDWLV